MADRKNPALRVKAIQNVSLRLLQARDIPLLNALFPDPEKWERYLKEQEKRIRTVYLIETEGKLAGYGTFLRKSEYSYFCEGKIPEISDLWIVPEYRGKGLATLLIKELEKLAQKEGYEEIGIGVGLNSHYGAAQKLYFHLGYAPDGRGIADRKSVV